MDNPRSLSNDVLNKTKKPKKVESKSISDSSCSDSFNTSSKKNWKLAVSENAELFYAKRSKKSKNNLPWPQNTTTSSFKLAAVKNSDINKELYLMVSSLDRYRFGRRSSIIESMLGFGVVPFCDNIECLMITNIIDSSLKLEFPYLQEGDWFKSMDNIEVRTENIDKLLLQYARATKVKLSFKGSYTSQKEREDKVELRELNNFEDFAVSLRSSSQNEPNFSSSQDDHIFLTLIINREYFKGENNECLFYYPFSSNNFLYKAKGSFLTLDSVINNDLRSKALQSTITIHDTKYYIEYGHVNDTLVVCAFSSSYQTKMAAKSNSNDFINFLKFNVPEYRTLEARQYLVDVCHVFKSNVMNDFSNLCFAPYTSSSLGIALPKEAQLRIWDALSEFESMDHKRWNETHKISSDLTVCGSALYFNKYLLTSNLPIDLRIPIECYLRVKGITSVFTFQNMKEMYIWEEIHKFDLDSKHYLAICIRNDLMLVTVLKCPLLTSSSITCIPYMEEITNTIEYLLSSGIDSISQFWIDSGKRPSLKKTNSQMPRKFKFTIQKDISIDNSENNTTLHHESPPHSVLTSEDGFKKSCDSESTSDWQTMSFNDFKEFNKDQEYIEPLLNEVKNIMPLNWSAGWSNDLKFYLHLNCSEAIILKPLKTTCSQLHLSVIRDGILLIHDVIHNNSISKKKHRDPNSNWNRITVLKEHGVSINLVNSLGEKETLFIVGRLFSFPMKEIYVCFGQNISQNLVELSFRMSLLNLG